MDFYQQHDRRRAPRKVGGLYPLRIGRRSARLVNWSATGIGIQVKEGTEGYRLGDRMTVSIHSEQTQGVAVFPVIVRRVDTADHMVGIEFVEDGENAVRFLVDLVGDKAAAGSHKTGAGVG
jgi:hypothetical protein